MMRGITGKSMKDLRDGEAEAWFDRQTPFGLLFKGILLIVALGLVFSVIGFFGGWFNTGKAIIGPKNVKKQWAFAYDFDEQLTATAAQWCTAKSAENAESDPDARTQRVTQRIAVENNYARIAALYNGRLRDAFRAKLVRPKDVPTRAPTLKSQTDELCPTG